MQSRAETGEARNKEIGSRSMRWIVWMRMGDESEELDWKRVDEGICSIAERAITSNASHQFRQQAWEKLASSTYYIEMSKEEVGRQHGTPRILRVGQSWKRDRATQTSSEEINADEHAAHTSSARTKTFLFGALTQAEARQKDKEIEGNWNGKCASVQQHSEQS